MNTAATTRLSGILLALGLGWGLSHPLTKIAATGGLTPLGMVFWQMSLGALALAPFVLRRRGVKITGRRVAFWAMIALIGTILPNSMGYIAIKYLPSGLISVIMSLIPMMAFPVALALGNEQFAWRRFAGLGCGLAGVLLIVLPDAALPDRAALAFLPLALVGPLCYAFEGNIVARWGTYGLDPLEVLFGASCIGTVIALPLALSQGQFFWPDLSQTPSQAFLGSVVIHVLVYTGYIWMVGRAGPVFAGQVSYIVTAAGVLWAMAILGESFSIWFWAAFAIILSGVALVAPRESDSDAASSMASLNP